MFRHHLLAAVSLLALSAAVCFAGARGPGKYCGVVIFDRFGGCTLYSGIYLMYVSSEIQAQLADQAGKCVQVDATRVDRPGWDDGVLMQLSLLGPAPDADYESSKGIRLVATPAFEDGQAPKLAIRAENTSQQSVELWLHRLAPTVLQRIEKVGLSDSNGPSEAIVTRVSCGRDCPRWGIHNSKRWRCVVTPPKSLESRVRLQPAEAVVSHVLLELPAGSYDFLASYGGGVHAGQCAASNLVALDVQADGTARLAKVPGR